VSAAARSARATRGSRGRLAGWVALLVVLAAALTIGVTDDGGPRTTGERARDLASSVACPTCDGQSVADSDAPAARGVRTFIEQRIDEGASDDEIRDELAESAYGDQILLTPGRSGIAGLVWVLPVVGLVLAFAGLAVAFRRWRTRSEVQASADDRVLVGKALSASRRADAEAEAASAPGDERDGAP
jgi:cytochrome c-type biogenesis protein CcmH